MGCPPNSDLKDLRFQASQIYFELIARLGDEKAIAQRIGPLIKLKTSVVRRYLSRFSFRNKKTLKKFIHCGNHVLEELNTYEINARALLVCDSKQSEIQIKEKVKHFREFGICIVAPQLLVDFQDTQFWDFVHQDAKYVDFIIAPPCLTDVKNNKINAIALMHNIPVMDEDSDDEIKAHALSLSIALLNK